MSAASVSLPRLSARHRADARLLKMLHERRRAVRTSRRRAGTHRRKRATRCFMRWLEVTVAAKRPPMPPCALVINRVARRVAHRWRLVLHARLDAQADAAIIGSASAAGASYAVRIRYWRAEDHPKRVETLARRASGLLRAASRRRGRRVRHAAPRRRLSAVVPVDDRSDVRGACERAPSACVEAQIHGRALLRTPGDEAAVR